MYNGQLTVLVCVADCGSFFRCVRAICFSKGLIDRIDMIHISISLVSLIIVRIIL